MTGIRGKHSIDTPRHILRTVAQTATQSQARPSLPAGTQTSPYPALAGNSTLYRQLTALAGASRPAGAATLQGTSPGHGVGVSADLSADRSADLGAALYCAREPALDEQVKAAICKDVAKRFLARTREDLQGLKGIQSSVSQSHFFMALLMDSVFIHHSGGDPEVVLSNQDAAKLFKQAIAEIKLDDNSKNADEAPDPSKVVFKPFMAQTMELVHNGFDGIERLRDIAYECRAFLFIDPVILDLLDKHGLDLGNPLLMFVFDASPSDQASYAHELAPKWIRAMESVDRPFDLAMLETIDGIDRIEFAGETDISFGCYSSAEGRLRMARFITVLEQRDISALIVEGSAPGDQVAYAQENGEAHCFQWPINEEEGAQVFSPPGMASVCELFMAEHAEDSGGAQTRFLRFHRLAEPQDADQVEAYNERIRTA
ncbi:MAG: hypothetical protein ACRYGK_00005, partial [Janthinobacterium lividum]